MAVRVFKELDMDTNKFSGKSYIQVFSATPRTKQFPTANREQRRGLLYKHPVKKFLTRATSLRSDLISVEQNFHPSHKVKAPGKIRFNNRKFLSGLYSQFLALSRRIVAQGV